MCAELRTPQPLHHRQVWRFSDAAVVADNLAITIKGPRTATKNATRG